MIDSILIIPELVSKSLLAFLMYSSPFFILAGTLTYFIVIRKSRLAIVISVSVFTIAALEEFFVYSKYKNDMSDNSEIIEYAESITITGNEEEYWNYCDRINEDILYFEELCVFRKYSKNEDHKFEYDLVVAKPLPFFTVAPWITHQKEWPPNIQFLAKYNADNGSFDFGV